MPTDTKTNKLEQPIVDYRLVVEVDGKRFRDWKNVNVTLDMDQASDTFNFSVGPLLHVTNGIADNRVLSLKPGRIINIFLMKEDDEATKLNVLRGIIDTQTIRSTGTDETLEIEGRDVMGVLVDSSVGSNLLIRNKTLLSVAKDILRPFTGEEQFSRYGTNWKQGDKGTEVYEAQEKLAELGYLTGKPDGIFGPQTTKAVKAFQADHGLQVDGIIGANTGAALGMSTEIEHGWSPPFNSIGAAVDGDTESELAKNIAGTSNTTENKKYQFSQKAKGPNPGDKCDSYLRGLCEKKGADMWLDSEQGIVVLGDRTAKREKSTPRLELRTYRDPVMAERNNLMDTQISRTINGRFSEYRIFGRRFDKNKRMAECVVKHDTTVPVYKPSFSQIEQAETPDDFVKKAEAMCVKGIDGALQVSGTTIGYGQYLGNEAHFYLPNTLVKLVHYVGGVNMDGHDESRYFYISKVSLSYDASGGPKSNVTLRLAKPEEFLTDEKVENPVLL